MKKVNRIELDSLLLHNACEIVFVRRRPERAPQRPVFRRMLCSKSMHLLNSVNGKLSLNFRFPRGPKKIDENKQNIIVAWDIFMQDYRNISMDACYLVQSIPDDDTFWKYYNEVLLPMTPEQKQVFMDSV